MTLVFYDHETETYTGSMLSKAKKLVELKLISLCYSKQHGLFWYIMPPPGNKRFYRVASDFSRCNCQGFNKNEKCTHILAAQAAARQPGTERWQLILSGVKPPTM